jgi:hypothetical protein
MCGNIRLAQIHHRLDQIFAPNNPKATFGNKNLLLFGDLLQV